MTTRHTATSVALKLLHRLRDPSERTVVNLLNAIDALHLLEVPGTALLPLLHAAEAAVSRLESGDRENWEIGLLLARSKLKTGNESRRAWLAQGGQELQRTGARVRESLDWDVRMVARRVSLVALNKDLTPREVYARASYLAYHASMFKRALEACSYQVVSQRRFGHDERAKALAEDILGELQEGQYWGEHNLRLTLRIAINLLTFGTIAPENLGQVIPWVHAQTKSLRKMSTDQLALLSQFLWLTGRKGFFPEIQEEVTSLDLGAPITEVERKISESVRLLQECGLSPRYQNRRTALTLLALLDLTPGKAWAEATSPLRGISQLMNFFSREYGTTYRPDSREGVRDESVAPLVEAGLAVPNPDDPDRPKTSPRYAYQIDPAILGYIRSFGSPGWETVRSRVHGELERLSRTRRTLSQSDRLHVFLCHAKPDKVQVRELYRDLTQNRVRPWFDEVDLLGGQDWRAEIRKAMRTVDVVIVCLSRASVDKAGFVQAEISFALDRAKEQPEGTIFIIPVRLEECTVPDRLLDYQYIDLFESQGYDRLLAALRLRARKLGKRLPT